MFGHRTCHLSVSDVEACSSHPSSTLQLLKTRATRCRRRATRWVENATAAIRPGCRRGLSATLSCRSRAPPSPRNRRRAKPRRKAKSLELAASTLSQRQSSTKKISFYAEREMEMDGSLCACVPVFSIFCCISAPAALARGNSLRLPTHYPVCVVLLDNERSK